MSDRLGGWMGGWLAGWVVFAETKNHQGLINKRHVYKCIQILAELGNVGPGEGSSL